MVCQANHSSSLEIRILIEAIMVSSIKEQSTSSMGDHQPDSSGARPSATKPYHEDYEPLSWKVVRCRRRRTFSFSTSIAIITGIMPSLTWLSCVRTSLFQIIHRMRRSSKEFGLQSLERTLSRKHSLTRALLIRTGPPNYSQSYIMIHPRP